jgi:hypothetical protein
MELSCFQKCQSGVVFVGYASAARWRRGVDHARSRSERRHPRLGILVIMLTALVCYGALGTLIARLVRF